MAAMPDASLDPPAPCPPQQSDARVCAACRATVHRAEVHRNRYGQYICKSCRSDGVRVVGRKALRYHLSRIPMALSILLGSLLLMFLLLVVVLVLAGQFNSYSTDELIEDIKDTVKSINRMAR